MKKTLVIILFLLLSLITFSSEANYELVTKWSSTKDTWQTPFGIAVDSEGFVYVAGEQQIVKYKSDGTFVLKIGNIANSEDYYLSSGEMYVAVDKSGNIYVSSSSDHIIVKFNAQGKYLTKWDTWNGGVDYFNYPRGIAVDDSGNVYVCDCNNHRIVIFDSNGTYINKWGGPGNTDGSFWNPTDIAIFNSNNIYVVDQNNYRIQVFDSNGTFQRKWGTWGSGDSQFKWPNAIDVDFEGNVYVINPGPLHRISKFSSDGTFLAKWGGYGNDNFHFNNPTDVAVDYSGNVFVADRNNWRIMKYRKVGAPTIEITNPTAYESVTGTITIQANVTVPSGYTVSNVEFYRDDVKLGEDSTPPFEQSWNTTTETNGPYTIWVVATNNGGSKSREKVPVVVANGDVAPTITITSPADQDKVKDSIDIKADASDAVGIAKVEYYVDGVKVGEDTSGPSPYIYNWDTTTVNDGQKELKVIAFDTIGQRASDTITITVKNQEEFGYVAKWSLDNPTGIAVDKNRNVYVASCDNRIRKYDADNNFLFSIENSSTGDYSLSCNMRIAVDPSGNIYVSVSESHSVVKFDAKGNYLKKWGSYGSENTQFISPRGIAVDSSGYVYVCDEGNRRIVKYTSEGVYENKWGTQGGGDTQFQCPDDVAVDASNNVYVVDRCNGRVQVFDSNGNFLRKWGECCGLGDYQFNNPWGIAIDSEGNVYVADTGNFRVVKYSSDGTFLAKWGGQGSGNLQFSTAWGIAVDSLGYVYVVDQGLNNRIVKFRSTWIPTIEITNPADNSIITGPITIQVNAQSEIGISKVEFYINGTKEHEDTTGPSPYTYDWNTSSLSNGTYTLKAIAYNVDNKSREDEISIVLNKTGDKIPTLSLANPKAGDTIKLTADIQANASDEDGGISKVEFYVDGNLVNTAIVSPPSLSYGYSYTWDATTVEDGERKIKVRAYDTIGQNVDKTVTVTVINHEEFGYVAKKSLDRPSDVTLDKSGNLYVAGGHQISKYNPAGNLILKIENNSSDYNFSWWMHIVVDNSAYIYVTNQDDNTVVKFNSKGNYVKKWGSFGSDNNQFYTPRGIAIDSDGNIYVCDHSNHRILKFNSDGTYITKWGTQGGSDGQFNNPQGIAIDSSNNIYVTDYNNHRIQVFNSSGVFIRKWGTYGYQDNQLRNPSGIAFDSEGNILVTDNGNYRVVKYTSSGAFLTKWGTRGSGDLQFECANGIAVDSNFYVYVADNCNNRIIKFKSTWKPTVEITNPADNSIITGPVTVKATVESAIAISKVEFYINGTKKHEDTTGPSPYTYDWDPSALSDGTYKIKAIAYNIQGKSTESDEISVVLNKSGNELPTVSITNPKAGDTIRLQATIKAEATDKEGIDRVEFYVDGTKVGEDTSNPYEYSWDATAVEDGERQIKVRAYDTIGQNVEKSITVTVINHEEFGFLDKWSTDNPVGLALDKDGNLYVAGRNRISKYAPDGNLILTIEDSGSDYNFSSSMRMTIDNSGFIYVTNSERSTVIKFGSNGNYIKKWGSFGSDNYQFNSPQGIAVDNNHNIYICDNGNNRIVKYDSNGTFLATWGTQGGSDGQFNWPIGIAVDASNNVYVADQHNHRIQVFTSDGEFLRKWGSWGYGDNNFQRPLGIAFDSEGNVYIVDSGNYRVVKYTYDGTFLAKWGTRGSGNLQFECPNDIVVDSNFYVYVSDNCNNRIVKFKSTWRPSVEITNPADNSIITAPVTIQATVESAIGTSKVEFYINGTKVAEDTTSPYEYSWNTSSLSNGTYILKAIAYNIQGKSAESDEISVVVNNTQDKLPTVSITNPKAGDIIRLQAALKAEASDKEGINRVEFYVDGTKVGEDASDPYEYSWDATTAEDGERQIKVRAYDTIGQNIEATVTVTVINHEEFEYIAKLYIDRPTDVALDKDGYLYVAGGNRVVKYSPDGIILFKIENQSNANYNLSWWLHVAVDDSGNIYVSNSDENNIIKFDSSGNYLTKWGSFGNGNNQFNNPQGIAVDKDRNVYVCDHNNNRISRFTSSGTFIKTWGSQGNGDGLFQNPRDIAVYNSNNVYVSDQNNHHVQVFNSDGEFLRKWGSWGYEDDNFRSPLGISFDSEGNVYIVDSGNYRVVKYTSDGTFLTKWGTQGSGDLQFACPNGIAVDSHYDVYVTDNCNNRVLKFKSTWKPTVEITNPADNSVISGPVTIQATVESSIGISKVEFYINGTKVTEDTTSPYAYSWNTSSLSNGTYILKAIAYNIQGKSTESDEISVVVNKSGDELPTVSITNPKAGDTIRLQETIKAEATDKEGIDRVEFYIDGTKVNEDKTNPYEYSWDATTVEDGDREINVRAYDTIGQNVEATIKVTVINHEEFGFAAKLYMDSPTDVAIDKLGNLYVAGGGSVSKYTPDGILISKIENQQNANYNLSWWLHVAVDDSGNIYVSNSEKNNIIKFDASGKYVTKWGSYGNGNNQLNNPGGIAVDKDGNVYVCDQSNHRISKFTSSGTFIRTWGSQGSSDGLFQNPRDIAADGANNVYVTDQWNNRVQVFNSNGDFLRKWGSWGYGDNNLRSPSGITPDSEGSVYVVDPGNYRVMKYTSNGTFLAKSGTQGNGDLQFECPNGIAIDYNFNVYVTDNCNNRVLKFKSTWKPTVEITNPINNSIITAPVTIQAAVESAIGISKVEFYVNGVKKHEDTTGPSPYTYDWNTSSLPDGTFSIKVIAYNAQGKSTESDEISVIVNNTGDEAPAVSIVSPEDGEVIRKTVELEADVSDDKGIDKVEFYVSGILVDSITVSSPSLSYEYIYSWDTTIKGDGETEIKVVVYDMIGQNTSAAIMVKVANQEAYEYVTNWSTWNYGNPRAIAVDKYGHIYVTFCDRIVKFTPTGSYLLKITNEGSDNNYQLTCSMRIAVDDDCNIYVSNRETQQVIKFDSKGKFVTKWGSQGDKDNQFNGPEGIAVDHEGNIYVCDSENHRIVKYSSGGIFLAKFGTRGNGDEQFQYPIGIDLDDSNNMYVAEAWNNRIQVLNSEGTYLRKWGNHGYGDSQFRCLQAIALDSEGNVYTTDGCNHRVQKFSADGTFITKWGSYGKGDNNFDNPYDIAVDSSGYAYVTDHGNQRIVIFRVLGTPSVAITSPINNSSVSGTVKVQASAQSEFGINRVEFYIGGELKHSDTDFPYEYTWDTASYSNGSYEIKAIAYNADLKSTQTSISVIVNNGGDLAPTVSITNIKEGAVIRGTVTVKADATDDLGISKVEFYVDGTLIGTDHEKPYEFSWDTTTVADGEKELKVIAYDTLGQRTWASIKVIVDNANAVFSVDLSGAAVVFINTERKLRKIDLNGNISPVVNTDPDMAQFQFGPQGNLYLFFWNPQELRDGNSYILVKVNPETNEAIGIDKTLSHIEWNEQTASPNIQFDGLGNIFYLARDSQWNLVLRKYTSEAQIEDLIHESIRIDHWHVREDGTVILGGETETTHLRWLRKLNLDGSLANIAEPSEIGWIKEFPDNRVYAGMRFSAWHHGVYRLPEDLSHMAEADEKKPYIGRSDDGYQPEYNVEQLVTGHTDEYCRGFHLWQGGAMLYCEKDSYDNVYGLMASWWDVYRTVLKLYPQPEIIEPQVALLDRPTLIKVWHDKLIIAGSKDGVNKLVLYDITTKEETNLLNKNIEIYHLDVLSNGNIIFDGLNFENNKIVVAMLGQQSSAPAGKARIMGYGFKELTELGGKPLSFGVFQEVSGSENISVSVTSFSGGSTVCGEVNIKAAAYSPGGVSKVEFYIDGELKATDTTSPYSYSWDTKSCPDGSCTIKVKAYDKTAQTAVSEITVTVDNTSPGEIDLSTTQIYFGAATNTNPTASQKFIISNTGGGDLNWTATSSENWLKVSPTSGKGSGIVTVSANTSGLSIGTYTGKITVQDPKATNTPQTVNATLKIYSSISVQKPFGSFDTPINGTTGITGAVPLTGWALDDIEVTKVEIWRDPVGGEPKAANGMVYIGNAILIEGARPDVVQNYPNYPLNFQAGWGYMLLTSYLPNQGNGTYAIYAVAYDKEGNKADLGVKTISCDNSHATKPFGTIDTPAQGGEASGKGFINFGWALTPKPNYIPQDGSTITVWINGEEVGHPVYNQSRQDVATLFPGYTNSNGAVGYFFLDTTQYKNGVHTMAWNVKDSAGNKDDIGTRYFTTVNVSSMGKSFSGMGSQTQTNLDNRLSFESVYSLATSFAPLKVWRGHRSEAEPETIEADSFGIIDIEIREVERLKVYLGDTTACDGYLVVGEKLRPLPVGSTLDVKKGTFSWQPGPGFIGTYDFIFLAKDENGLLRKIRARVTIFPKFDIY
jgi:DNA-binding beta-propeller fold protein YncE